MYNKHWPKILENLSVSYLNLLNFFIHFYAVIKVCFSLLLFLTRMRQLSCYITKSLFSKQKYKKYVLLSWLDATDVRSAVYKRSFGLFCWRVYFFPLALFARNSNKKSKRVISLTGGSGKVYRSRGAWRLGCLIAIIWIRIFERSFWISEEKYTSLRYFAFYQEYLKRGFTKFKRKKVQLLILQWLALHLSKLTSIYINIHLFHGWLTLTRFHIDHDQISLNEFLFVW